MGKSLGNAIYLSDTPEDIAMKVRGMYTDPGHLRVSDPGKVEGNPVFAYLDAFDPDTDAVEEMKEHYSRGGLGDVVVKKRLTEVLLDLTEPMREKRNQLARNPEAIMEILHEGSEAARRVAIQTLEEAREAMGLKYF